MDYMDPMSSVLKKADKLHLSLSLLQIATLMLLIKMTRHHLDRDFLKRMIGLEDPILFFLL